MGSLMNEARERILEAAEELFLRHGFSAVTMDELAAHLGMSKKTLYQHFPSKDGLIEEVLDKSFAKLFAELDAVLEDEARDHTEKVDQYLSIVTGRYGMLSSAVLRDLQKSAPTAFRRFQALQRGGLETRFRKLLSDGIEKGVFRADIDVRILIRMVQSMVAGVLSPEALSELSLGPLDGFRAIIGVLFDGILARSPEPR